MKTWVCASCGGKVYFENTMCLRCGHQLGFDSRRLVMVTLEKTGDDLLLPLAGQTGDVGQLKYCRNGAHKACNWLTSAADESGFCTACDMNRIIPDLSEEGALPAWQDFERAKKRLVYQLLRFGLPLDAQAEGKARLAFDFARGKTTGHLNGVISIDLMEADDVWREQQRKLFEEPYRSLLGHLRHESGHYYWMLFVDTPARLGQFRDLFGDERSDYKAALASHYGKGPGPGDNWQMQHVSAYAAAHPWEDWAESFAHYLHMIDALETAETWGLEPRAGGLVFGSNWPFLTCDVYREETFEALMERWVPLTLALNSLSRSMGHIDFYPFVISYPARQKLGFVHDVIRSSAQAKK